MHYWKIWLFLVFLLQFSTGNIFNTNNVCKTFSDYSFPYGNKNCSHNPDTSLSAPDIIRKYAGKVESHEMTTEDGYILTMFRIPRQSPRGTIVLQHSIAVDSRIFVGSGSHSLGLILWAAGYDVWLANMRGTRYSQRHQTLTVADTKYWNFTFHEIGFYDVSSQVRYINQVTGDSQIIYIGHSLGTTTGLVYASMRSQEAKKYVKVFILISTVAQFQHVSSPVYSLQTLIPFFTVLPKYLPIGPFIPIDPPLIYDFSRIFLKLFPFFLQIANYFISFLLGFTPEELDPALFNHDTGIYLNNFPYKMLLHFAQLAHAKNRFQLFDYGCEQNKEIYGTCLPPEYPIGNISVPIFMISSKSDSLASAQDAEEFRLRLNENVRTYGHLFVNGLNHFDFYFGRHRQQVFVDQLLDFLRTKL